MPPAFSGFRVGVQHRETFRLQCGHEQSAFAEQLGGDVFDSDFQRQFHRGNQADKTDEIMSAGLEFHRAGRKTICSCATKFGFFTLCQP